MNFSRIVNPDIINPAKDREFLDSKIKPDIVRSSGVIPLDQTKKVTGMVFNPATQSYEAVGDKKDPEEEVF